MAPGGAGGKEARQLDPTRSLEGIARVGPTRPLMSVAGVRKPENHQPLVSTQGIGAEELGTHKTHGAAAIGHEEIDRPSSLCRRGAVLGLSRLPLDEIVTVAIAVITVASISIRPAGSHGAMIGISVPASRIFYRLSLK